MTAPAITLGRDAYTWDGVPFDLAFPMRDRSGVEWHWAGDYTAVGEPLMAAADGVGVMPLPDLYRDLCPLRPRLPRLISGVGELLPSRGVRCADGCGRPARPGDAWCGPLCRNRDNQHDDYDDPEDDD